MIQLKIETLEITRHSLDSRV